MKKSTRKSRRHRNPQAQEENKKPFFSKANDTSIQTKTDQPFFQTKLTVGQPGDKYEQEADAVADAVVNKSDNTPAIQQKKISSIQRYATNAQEDEKGTNTQRIEEDKMIQEKPIQKMEGEEEESVQMMEEEEESLQAKEEEEPIQKMEGEEEESVQMMEEEEESVQAKEEEEPIQKMEGEEEESVQMMEEEEEPVQTKSNSTAKNTASPQVAKQLKQSKGSGSALSKSTRAEMENSFGVDFSQVKIHTNKGAINLNKNLGAQAFTHGKDVYFNDGKFSPTSREGKKLLAHELTHVVQQNGDLKNVNLKKEGNIIQRQEGTEPPTEENRPSARELFEEARTLYDNGAYQEAITKFQQLMHTDEMMNGSKKRLAKICFNIAIACLKLRWVASANYYFEIYKNYHPDREDADAKIAEARRGMGMQSNEVEEAGETDEQRARQIFRRATAHFNNGNYITAIILFERSRVLTSLPPKQKAKILFNIGVANLRLGRYAIAVTYLQEYRRYHPGAEADEKLLEAQRGAGII